MTQETRAGLVGAGVLALLGVLAFGLVLPGISQARYLSGRTMCQNNLMQLALACHNYEDTTGRLPAGTHTLADVPPERRLSWIYSTLPYYESGPLFAAFNNTLPADHPVNRPPGQTAIRGFLRPRSSDFDALRTGTLKAPPVPSAYTHYFGVAGIGADAALLPAVHSRAGAFGYDRERSLKDGFPDSLANTLLLAEVGRNPGPWAVGGPGTVRGLDADGVPVFGPTRPAGGFHAADTTWFRARRFSCMVALADASVRWLSPDVDPAVLAALATAGGREPIPE